MWKSATARERLGSICTSCGPIHEKERQGHGRPDEARDDVSDRNTPTGGLASPRAFEKRIERRADVCSNDEGHRGVEWHDAFLSEGHHKQHDRNARVRSPGQQRTKRQRNQRIGGDTAHENAQAWNVLVGRDDFKQLRQGDKHQPEPNRNTTHVTCPRSAEAVRKGDVQEPMRERPEARLGLLAV